MRNKKRNRTCWNSPDFLTNFYNFFPNCTADTVITKHRLVRSSTNLSRSESIIINKRLERVEKWTIRHRNERSYRISLHAFSSFLSKRRDWSNDRKGRKSSGNTEKRGQMINQRLRGEEERRKKSLAICDEFRNGE